MLLLGHSLKKSDPHSIIKKTDTSILFCIFAIALNVPSKQDFITYYCCQNSVNRPAILLQRNKEKVLSQTKLTAVCPQQSFSNLHLVHFRKVPDEGKGNADTRRKCKQAVCSPLLGTNREGPEAGLQVHRALAHCRLKPQGGNLTRTIQSLRTKPKP